MLSGYKAMTAGAISIEQSRFNLHVRDAGKGEAFIVASVPGEEAAAAAARRSYRVIADALA